MKPIIAEGHRGYCADNEDDVRLCMERGASPITANDPVPLLRVLGRMA